MKFLLATIAVIFAIICAFNKKEISINEQYVVLKIINNIEIRNYKESINASYYNDFDEEKNNYFRNLAAYIFGGNSENKDISMTSPVTMRLYGNKEMIFRMPEEYSLESLPKSDNPNIRIVVIPASTKAAISYGGYSNNYTERKKIHELKRNLKENNLIHNDQFEVLVYNSPFKIINRRNEITVNITYP